MKFWGLKSLYTESKLCVHETNQSIGLFCELTCYQGNTETGLNSCQAVTHDLPGGAFGLSESELCLWLEHTEK